MPLGGLVPPFLFPQQQENPVDSKDVTVTLPLDSINAALMALSKFPYEQAQPHIDLIRSSVNAALQTPVTITAEEVEA